MPQRPTLIVKGSNLPETAADLRDLVAATGYVFDRNGPVRVINGPRIHSLDQPAIVNLAHRIAYVRENTQEGRRPVTLPDRAAKLYLAMNGDWHLLPLDGITTAPILMEDGEIRSQRGYIEPLRVWSDFSLPLAVPEAPTRQDAEAALATIRHRFRTFAFADSALIDGNPPVIDINQPPRLDESAFLCALLTAIARASIDLAPGVLLTAPQFSGAGSGKGLLTRAIAMIAFGIRPHAITAGESKAELEKRLAAALLDSGPMLFLDNVNGTALKSDLLASVVTERPARVRILGESRTAEMNCTAFIVVTGNGLSVSEDLARRFLHCALDPRTEDPESRKFEPGFLKQIANDRADLLCAALTIWRWGRLEPELAAGQPLGSFETWARWVRDPLLALGCADPVERIAEAKAADPERRRITDLFSAWHEHHGERWMKVSDLDTKVCELADPGGARQRLVIAIARLAGTQIAGFKLESKQSASKWRPAEYRVVRLGADLRVAA